MRSQLMTIGLAAMALTLSARDSVMFIGAHPDDVENCIGLMLRMKADYDIRVVDMTRGENGCGQAGWYDGTTAVKRIAEERAVCQAFACEPVFLSAMNHGGCAYAEPFVTAELVKLLVAWKPKAVFVNWPIDQHMDHVQCAAMTMHALALAQRDHGIKPELYYYEEQPWETQNYRPLYYVDVTDVIDRTCELIGLYRSQKGERIAARKRVRTAERGRTAPQPVAFAESYNAFHGERYPDGVLERYAIPSSARRDFRRAVAAGGTVADKAIADGLHASDPAIRRAALWELYAKDPDAAFERLEWACLDASREVSSLAAELARAIPDEARRERLLRQIAAHGMTPEAKRIAATAIRFPFHRDDIPLSQNPTYDHDLVKAWVWELPTDGWKFRADTSVSGHLGDQPLFGPEVDLTADGWKSISIGRHWESFPGVGNYDGIGWCVVEFDLPAKVDGLSYELCFDAVDEEAWVWVNGQYVGQHDEGIDGWNKPFRLDVGKELRWGGRNRLVVRVNDTFAGGGIHKGIRLEVLK